MARIQQVVSAFPAAGVGPWIHHDFYQTPFCLSLIAYSAPTGGASFTLEYTIDNFMEDAARRVVVNQAGTTITVTDSGPHIADWAGFGLTHGLNVGDWVQLRGTPRSVSDGGWSVASVIDATHYTLTVTSSATYETQGMVHTARVVQATATDKTVEQSLTTPRQTWRVLAPITASRLRASAAITGYGILLAEQGGNLGGRI